MIYHCHKSRWVLILSSVISFFSCVAFQSVAANEADGLRVTDYFISHTSNEPFYSQYKLEPRVTLHVREVVLAGRERTVPK